MSLEESLNALNESIQDLTKLLQSSSVVDVIPKDTGVTEVAEDLLDDTPAPAPKKKAASAAAKKKAAAAKKKAAAAKTEAVDELTGEVITIERVKTVLRELTREHALEALSRFGCTKLSDVEPAKYDKLIALVKRDYGKPANDADDLLA